MCVYYVSFLSLENIMILLHILFAEFINFCNFYVTMYVEVSSRYSQFTSMSHDQVLSGPLDHGAQGLQRAGLDPRYPKN